MRLPWGGCASVDDEKLDAGEDTLDGKELGFVAICNVW
jgi:hypothetical protein